VLAHAAPWGGRGRELDRQYLNALVDRVVAGYHKSLLWVLQHERATLLTTLATLVITIGLYVIVPRVSCRAGHRTDTSRAGGGAPGLLRRDGQNAGPGRGQIVRTGCGGVVTVVGVSSLNPTPNAGHLKVTLKRAMPATPMSHHHRQLKEKVGAIPAVTSTSSPCRTMANQHAHQPGAVSDTLVGSDEKDVATWTACGLTEKLRFSPALREVVSESQDGGLRIMVRVAGRQPVASASHASHQMTRSTTRSAKGRSRPSTPSNQYRVVSGGRPPVPE